MHFRKQYTIKFTSYLHHASCIVVAGVLPSWDSTIQSALSMSVAVGELTTAQPAVTLSLAPSLDHLTHSPSFHAMLRYDLAMDNCRLLYCWGWVGIFSLGKLAPANWFSPT